MDKGSRLFTLVVVLSVAALILVIHWAEVASLGNAGIVIFSAITMMALSILMLEHYFTRPTDVIATSTSVILLLAPVHADMKALGIWYWVLLSYAGLMLSLSIVALLLLNPEKSSASLANKSSLQLKKLATVFGNAKLLWFLVFSSALFSYVDNSSPLFIWLAIVSGFLLAVDPKNISIKFLRRGGESQPTLARVIGVQSGDLVLAKMEPFAASPSKFDFVQVNTRSSSGLGAVALVVDAYTLDEERWVRVLSGRMIEQMAGPATCTSVPAASLCRLEAPDTGVLFSLFAGVVREGSNIDRIKFDYAGSAGLSEGSVLYVQISDRRVFYQVIDGVTVSEILESKNEAGLIVGEAVQLGTWSAERQVFEKFGWLPLINSPVFLASTNEELQIPDGEVRIGTLPGTSYAVSIDLDSAISHHIAILGVTGSGKSVFAREFVRRAMDSGRKTICVDFTGEYQTKLTGTPISTIVDSETAEHIIDNLEFVSAQMDEFANRRDKPGMAAAEARIEANFRAAFEAFLRGDNRVVLFALPDVTNSSVLLDYTKWFFKILFKIAKESRCFGAKVCVVLEEAHTVIPEWNFLGVEEKRATALVNSIGQIALQGRKYGVGFVVIAQRTANVSKTVLTQCNTIVAFQQFDKTSAEFLSNYMGDMSKALSRLKPRTAIAVGKAFRGGMPIIFEVPNIIESD